MPPAPNDRNRRASMDEDERHDAAVEPFRPVGWGAMPPRLHGWACALSTRVAVKGELDEAQEGTNQGEHPLGTSFCKPRCSLALGEANRVLDNFPTIGGSNQGQHPAELGVRSLHSMANGRKLTVYVHLLNA